MSTSDLSLGGVRDAATIEWRLPSYTELVYSLVIIWGFGDIMSTFFAVTVSGNVGMEANPWIRILLTHEPLLVLALKAAVVLYAGVVLLECRQVIERVPGWRAWFIGVVSVGALVTLNNVVVGLAAVA